MGNYEKKIVLKLIFIFCFSIFLQISVENLQAQSLLLTQKSYPLSVRATSNLSASSKNKAWQGGLNGVVISQYKDKDQKENLLIFDKDANRPFVFTTSNGNFKVDLKATYNLPQAVSNWMIAKSYNGQTALFTYHQSAPKIYGLSTDNNWELIEKEIFTFGFNSPINLIINATDVPAINDVNGDNKTDILSFNFSNGSKIDYHKNISDNPREGASFERVTRSYGQFEDCNCDHISFGTACNGGSIENVFSQDSFNARDALHAGGKTLLALDLNMDNATDLIFGDETCTNLTTLINKKEINQTAMKASDIVIPSPSIFPSAFFIQDSNNQNESDFQLFTSTNKEFEEESNIDLSKTIYKINTTYKKGVPTNEGNIPVFTTVQEDFLQADMLDLGMNASPAFIDIDNDEDLDLWIAASNSGSGRLYVFRNIGTTNQPSFRESDNVFSMIPSLENKSFLNPRIQFEDINKDGIKDLLLTAHFVDETPIKQTQTKYYLGKRSTGKNEIKFEEGKNLAETFRYGDYPYYHDVNKDGEIDLIISKLLGFLEYYEGQSLIFLKKEEQFLGIKSDIFSRQKSLAILDFNKNNKRGLLFTNRRGEMKYWPDVIDQYALDEAVAFDKIENVLLKIEDTTPNILVDIRTWPVFTDLDNNGKLDLFLGTARGGIELFEIDGDGIVPSDDAYKVKQTYLKQGDQIIVSGVSDGEVHIYDATGRLLRSEQMINGSGTQEFESEQFVPGVYFIQFLSDGKKKASIPIIIYE